MVHKFKLHFFLSLKAIFNSISSTINFVFIIPFELIPLFKNYYKFPYTILEGNLHVIAF